MFRKKSPRAGTLNTELLQRIDNMEDKHDYNPYQAVKRTNMNTTDLFDDSDYEGSNGSNGSNGEDQGISYDESPNASVIAIILIVVALLVGLGVLAIIKLGVV